VACKGNYRLPDLLQGPDYVIEAETSGFEKFVRTGLVVRAGLNVTVDIGLSVGSQNQTVQVSGDAPLIVPNGNTAAPASQQPDFSLGGSKFFPR
jgi:hypothetical protein